MTAHSVLNVRAALEWGNSELYKYYERNGLGYGTIQIRDPNVEATVERPWKVLIQRRHQLCCPFREHRQDTVSALAGAHQVVLGDHEEYLVVQMLQFLSPHFRVAFPQPTESRHLRGQSVFSGLFIQRQNGLKSAFVFLEGERNRRTGIPPPRLEMMTFL